MSGLWSYFLTKMAPGGDRSVQKDGMTKLLTLVQRVCEKTKGAERMMEEIFTAVGTRVVWYQITGDKFKPVAWGDEAVIIDADYLSELPVGVGKVMVAERVLQVSSAHLKQERFKITANLLAGTAAGAFVVLYRRGQANTLRRAFTIAAVSTVGGAFLFRHPPSRHHHLTEALHAFNDADTTSAVLAFEEQKLAAIEQKYNENAVINPDGVVQHRLLDVLEREDALKRVESIRAI